MCMKEIPQHCWNWVWTLCQTLSQTFYGQYVIEYSILWGRCYFYHDVKMRQLGHREIKGVVWGSLGGMGPVFKPKKSEFRACILNWSITVYPKLNSAPSTLVVILFLEKSWSYLNKWYPGTSGLMPEITHHPWLPPSHVHIVPIAQLPFVWSSQDLGNVSHLRCLC